MFPPVRFINVVHTFLPCFSGILVAGCVDGVVHVVLTCAFSVVELTLFVRSTKTMGKPQGWQYRMV